MYTKVDISGKRYGRLTVIKLASTAKQGRAWLCKCDCGNETIVPTARLNNGNTTSCGCRKLEAIRHESAGLKGTPIYNVWTGVKQRCYDKNAIKYSNYGGRGITVCSEWINSPESFINWAEAHGYKRGLVIDRIDNNGNYEPNNCRFVTQKENCNNKNNNVRITFNGVTHTATEWSEMLHLSQKLILSRFAKGIPAEQIFNPVKKSIYDDEFHKSNTGIKGISFQKSNQRFVLYVNHKYRGCFKTLPEAICEKERASNE